eukprot:gene2034-13003_t
MDHRIITSQTRLSLDKLVEIYAYTKFYWVRTGNEEFGLDGFDRHEKHFTVHNYQADAAMLVRQSCIEFERNFEEQHKVQWREIEQKIFKMMAD